MAADEFPVDWLLLINTGDDFPVVSEGICLYINSDSENSPYIPVSMPNAIVITASFSGTLGKNRRWRKKEENNYIIYFKGLRLLIRFVVNDEGNRPKFLKASCIIQAFTMDDYKS